MYSTGEFGADSESFADNLAQYAASSMELLTDKHGIVTARGNSTQHCSDALQIDGKKNSG